MTTPTRLPRALRPFRHAPYRPLALALAFSVFAHGAWTVGLVWEVIRIGGSANQLSVVASSAAVGVLVPALLAGVVADRLPQKLILQAVAAVDLLCLASAALLSALDLTQIWHLAVIGFTAGLAMAFYYPAYSAWLPALVPAEDLMAVNGFESAVRPLLYNAVGPAVAGAVVGALSPSVAILIAAAAALGALVVLSWVPRTPVRRRLDDDPTRMLADLVEGFRYMVRTPWLLATLLFASLLVLAVMGPIEVLVPFLVKDRLGGGPEGHATVLAAFGIGGAVGSLVMASMRMPRRYLTWMNLMWGAGASALVLMGVATTLWVVVVAGFALGALFSAPMVIWGTLLQRRVPPHLLGRVASLDFFVSTSLMPVSMAVAGPLAELIGLRATFIAAGLLPIVAAVVAIWWARLPADELAHPLRDEPAEALV